MSEFPIEKGVPLTSASAKYPFRDMEPGDSFFVPGATKEECNRVQAAFDYWNLVSGGRMYRLARRKQQDGVRFWLFLKDGVQA